MFGIYHFKRFIKFYGSLNTLKTLIFKLEDPQEDGITIIITSSGRLKYLKKTINSLKSCLITQKKVYWHIIDDNPSSQETRQFISNAEFDLVLFNKKNRGLGYSLNRIYRTVKTKYIFHCEDDWEFLTKINIDSIIQELGDHEQIILNREQPQKETPTLKNGNAFLIRYYSFNPHIVKTQCALQLLPFSNKNTERTISDIARRSGINSRIYGYNFLNIVSHIGEIQTVKKY